MCSAPISSPEEKADPGRITTLLHAHAEGDPTAFEELIPLLYGHLERLARSNLRRIPPNQSLDTIGLINEAYLRLVGGNDVSWENRAHFLAITARVMRRVVVDRARHKLAAKRGGGGLELTFDPELTGNSDKTETVLAVHQALKTIESIDPRLARVVEGRCFAGMTMTEIAEAHATPLRTVERDWQKARAWLRKLLSDQASP